MSLQTVTDQQVTQLRLLDGCLCSIPCCDNASLYGNVGCKSRLKRDAVGLQALTVVFMQMQNSL